ncbi:MAG: DUF2637 domain-containing protein [Mycolicibacterium mageritense]|nr:MAG: DUF2637 domain-containing protein [Mycolicibacterium mageritense]
MTVTDVPARNGAELHPHSQPRAPRPVPERHVHAQDSSDSSDERPAQVRRRRDDGRLARSWRSRRTKALSPNCVDAVEAEIAAQRAEHFFRAWLVVATAISVVANVAHAWLTAPAGMRVGAAVAALVPPSFLFVQTHSVFLMIKARRFDWAFVVSLIVTVMIAVFAFRLSYGTIRGLVIMLGTAPADAGQWPLVIDLSIVGCTVCLFAMSRRRRRNTTDGEGSASAEESGDGELPYVGVFDESALSPTERRMLWDRAASVVKERHPDLNAIASRPVSQIADILRFTHEDGMKQRDIVDQTGLSAHTVRTIQRAAVEVLARTDPNASLER